MGAALPLHADFVIDDGTLSVLLSCPPAIQPRAGFPPKLKKQRCLLENGINNLADEVMWSRMCH